MKTVSELKLESSITLHRRFQPSEGLLGHCWHPFRDHFGVLVWDPSREGEFLKIIEKPMENLMIFKVPRVPKIEKSYRKVTSKRKLAARASWEAPGIAVGVVLGS